MYCFVLWCFAHYSFVLDCTTKNAEPPIRPQSELVPVCVIVSFLRHFNAEKQKELTDARAFPISSPELPAVVPRLAAGRKSN